MTQMNEGVNPRGASSNSGSDDPDYKSTTSKILQMYVYSTKDASNHILTFHRYARRARAMLLDHRLDLRAYPGLPTVMGDNDLIIDWDATITLHDHKEQIMEMSQKRKETPEDALPVILCTISDQVGDQGEKIEFKGRPFVLIYGNHPSADDVTLLHEIGHAAKCKNHPPWGLGRPDKRYDFMATPAEFPPDSEALKKTQQREYFRNTIFKPDVLKLANAKFAVHRGLCYYPPMFVGG
jgi:hypothetical protein